MIGVRSEKTSGRSKAVALIVYTVVFYALWTAWELWAKDLITAAVGDPRSHANEYLSQFIKSGIVKNLVWTLPAVLLVKRFEGAAYVLGSAYVYVF